jgi:carbamoyl-phosphate synthase large subunit
VCTSGDSGCSLPPISLSPGDPGELREQTRKLAKALSVIGLMNIQFAIQNGIIYVLEVNPRASRTGTVRLQGHRRAAGKIGARVMTGKKMKTMQNVTEVIPPYFSVKEAVFPFTKFPEADPILGPEMKSTGRSHGHGPYLWRGLREGAGGFGSHLAAQRRGAHQRA